MEALGSHRHWELLCAVLTEVGYHDESAIGGGVTAIGLYRSGGTGPDGEGVRGGGGGHLPLDGAHPQLGPDAVLICLRQQHLAASKIVAFDIS